MADIDVFELSDSQLRKHLQSYGENIGPITKTTRKTLEKKLQKLLSSGVKQTIVQEQEQPKKKTVTASPGRRRSTGRATRKSVEPVKNNFAPFSSDEDVSSKISVQTSPIGFPENNTKAVLASRSVRSSRRKTMPPKLLVQKNDETDTRFNPKNIIASTDDPTERSYTAINNKSTLLTKKSSDYSTSHSIHYHNNKTDYNNKSEFSDEDFPPVNNRSSYKPPVVINSLSYNTQSKHISTPPRVGFHNSSNNITMRSKSKNLDDSNIRDEIDKSLSQIRKVYSIKKPSPITSHIKQQRAPLVPKQIESDEEDDEIEEELEVEFVSSKISLRNFIENYINFSYLVIGILVFAFLVGIYFYKEPDVILTGITDKSGKLGEEKLEKETNGFIRCLYQKLCHTAGEADCGYIENKAVDLSSLKQYAQSCLTIKMEKEVVKKAVTDIKGDEAYNNYFVIADETIASKHSYRSLQCRIYQAVSTIFFRLAVFILVLLLCIGIYFFLKRRWMTDDEETRMMMYFVHKIIDTLKRHQIVCMSDTEIPPYLPLPHVRDMLIPVAKRKTMGKTWQKAVDFLNSSESRIRVETQRIAGEDFDVWRWIGVSTPKLKKEKKAAGRKHLVSEQNKCWQGPAFEEIEKVVRMPIVTPTPCLKIRYMHDGPDEKEGDWIRATEDAILEKCGKDGAQILHIYVDVTSKEGCVYVKCDSLDSAGKAFRSIYGNWFDGRLVIVKFVTLARYHQRFPDALNCGNPIQPSGKSASSLAWAKDTAE